MGLDRDLPRSQRCLRRARWLSPPPLSQAFFSSAGSPLGCSGPPIGPSPPPPPPPARMGGRSGPVGARSRPPTLPTDKETASSARRPNSGRDSRHGAGGLCDDPVLPHLGGALCGLRRGGDCGRPVVPPPSCLPPRLPSLSSCAFSSQIAPCSFLRSFRLMRAFYPHILTHAHLTVATSCR